MSAPKKPRRDERIEDLEDEIRTLRTTVERLAKQNVALRNGCVQLKLHRLWLLDTITGQTYGPQTTIEGSPEIPAPEKIRVSFANGEWRIVEERPS